MIHPHPEFWRKRKGSPYRILLPAWVGLWIVFGAANFHWHSLVLYDTWWAWLPAVILFSIGIWLYRHSGDKFSLSQLAGLPELQSQSSDQRLVTSGLRNRIRHPIYLAHLCEMLAWSLGSGLIVCDGLTVFAVATGAIMISLEDKELQRRFGEEFREYRRRVPALLPRI
jgi:protein-S-isoprenylcysteine O-methyltransferase Ste14